ncbi:MAG: hypothetical protein WAM13_01175 [Candidatus Sulfotelmatobacter sp.]
MRIRDLVIRNIVSPYGMTFAALLLFLVAFLFPPGLYSSYVQEPDLMFLDPASLAFFLLCTLGFLLGLMLIDFVFPVRGFRYEKRETRISPMWFLLVPLIAGTALTILSIVLLLRNNTYLLELLLAAEGRQLKSDGGIDLEGTISLATPVLMGIVWWAIWRKNQFSIRGWRRFTVHSTIIVATLTMLVSSTLRLARGDLMPMFAGIAILFLLHRLMSGRLRGVSVLKFVAFCTVSIVALFILFSMLRGLSTPDDLIGNILGYTIGAYNRLAAVVNGRLRYPFSGRGLYISGFVSFNKTFNELFRVNQLFAWPDFDTVWQSEFGAVTAAGLDGRLLWSGTFGYIFSDLKWLSPLFLFIYGLGTGWAWRLLKLGKTTGIVLYPWCAFCILFWFGTNYLLDPRAVVLLLVAISLGLYELIFVRASVRVVH